MKTPRIMIVEDAPDVSAILARVFSDRGYHVLPARTGFDALRIAREEQLDLVVLDLALPGLDGLQVCSYLRKDPQTSELPVLMLTARGGTRDIVNGFSVGADDYVVKPCDNEVLLARVAALIRRGPRSHRTGALTSPPDTRQIRPGHLHGYRLVERISSGSMGTVHKAIQVALDRYVAVKILDEPLARDQTYVARFMREAKLAATLNHPNIVSAIDAGEHDGQYYFVMEFVEGESVDRIIEREGRMQPWAAARTAIEVARALDHARSRGLIHRDVKPGNIMIATDGTVKLTDLGLARSIATDFATTASLNKKLVGTPDYMSPEQILRPTELDTRADVYALGATLFDMLTGQPPFMGATVMDVIRKHLYEPRPFASDTCPAVDHELAAVVRKAMAIDRSRRFQTPGEMADALETVAPDQPDVRRHKDSDVLPAGIP